jgi:hypothetical protein
MQGCDGKQAWVAGPDGRRTELKPKIGYQGQCKIGYDIVPLSVRDPNSKIELKGKKNLGTVAAWQVRTQNPESLAADTYYFDAENYLLIRWDRGATKHLYFDYRDVGGIKIPFVVKTSGNAEVTTTLREVEINRPLDDARFQEFGAKRQEQVVHVEAPAPTAAAAPSPSPSPASASAPAQLTHAEIPAAVPGDVHAGSRYVNAISFVSSSVAEIKEAVPELKGLKPVKEQNGLLPLLDKVGAKTRDLSREIPSLISREEVVESRQRVTVNRQTFSYLMLAHRDPDAVTLEEFRLNSETGELLQTEDARKPATPGSRDSPSLWDDLSRASRRASTREDGSPPLSQGFASMWIRFYPANRSESTFRYLGQQKMNGHHTIVIAFAQKPGSVRMPAEVRLENKTLPVFFQGVAWIDASDFRIVRLRTDLLSPLTEYPLSQLTSDVLFADTRAGGFSTTLWLPQRVEVTTVVDGRVFEDQHRYSDYHSFQVRSRILLDR